MPVSDVWKMSRNRPRGQSLNALQPSAEVKARRNPPKCHELENDDKFLKKRKKREDISV